MAVRERSGSKRANLRGYLIASLPLSVHLEGAFLPEFDCHKQEVQHPQGRHAPNVLPRFAGSSFISPIRTTPSLTNFPLAPHLSSRPNQHRQLLWQLAIEVDKVSQRKWKKKMRSRCFSISLIFVPVSYLTYCCFNFRAESRSRSYGPI